MELNSKINFEIKKTVELSKIISDFDLVKQSCSREIYNSKVDCKFLKLNTTMTFK